MEGYSVTEAASILGVTTERVWELLARGVLAGAPDAETGMRVYLQPRPAPAPPAVEVHARTDAPRADPERELSPFRELLTEFRSLTERYGQALLALGESRGEVASLRSRVDLLEARVDLRLSGAAPSPVMPWLGRHGAGETAPEPPPGAGLPRVPDGGGGEEHGLDATAGEGTADEADVEARGRRRRSSHRHATDVFAEALARAQDPSLRDLPGAAEAADALAALREETRVAAETEAEATDAALPRELPVADAVPVLDELAPEEPVAEDLAPELVAEAEPAPTGPAAPQPQAEQEEEEAVGVPEPEPQENAEPEPEPDLEAASSEPEREVVPEPEVTAGAPPEAEVEAGDQQAPAIEPVEQEIREAAALQEAATAAVEAEQPAVAEPTIEVAAAEPATDVAHEEPVAAEREPAVTGEPIEWDHERYTTSLGEPDWYAADDLPSPPPLPSAVARPVTEELAAEIPRATSDEEPWPIEDEVAPPSESTALAEQLPGPDDQPELPAATEDGADEMEVAATGTSRPGETRLPGAWDLDDALRALDALAGRSRGEGQPVATPSDATERSYRSPASRAYRRLRRILPG